MIIEHGDLSNPTGNAVIFWHIRGNSKLLKKAEIIASNFVVSPLQSNEETLMVNFPPVLVDNHEKLLKIAEANNIDLIRGGEIYVPEDITDFSNFYKKQIEKYNGIIREYLIAFKEKNSTKDNEKRSGKKSGSHDAQLDEALNLPQLIGQAGKVLKSIRTFVKSGSNRNIIEVKKKELGKIEAAINREMKGFDFEGIIDYIEEPDEVVDSLVELHMRKLFAVFLEDYETAEELKKKILSLERSHNL